MKEENKEQDGAGRFHNIRRTLTRDLTDIYDFYLDEEQKSRLEGMNLFRRTLFLFGWLSKNLFLKLTPIRRVLLLIAVFFLFMQDMSFAALGINLIVNNTVIGSLILIFILMLELKDKLLARSELAEGRAIQKWLMPAVCPEIKGWDVWFFTRPANDVGGDLVDCIGLGESHFGLVLADVSGKGLPAALLMAKLQASIRALAADSASLVQLGAKVNQIFHRDAPASSFATLVYLDVHGHDGRLAMINAGHLPPIICRSGQLSFTPKGDSALGLSPDTRYELHRETLEAGEFMFVYSDGIHEAKNVKGEGFGLERLYRLLDRTAASLPAAKIGERILEALDQFIGDARPHDDQTLLIVRRLP